MKTILGSKRSPRGWGKLYYFSVLLSFIRGIPNFLGQEEFRYPIK